MKTSRNMAILVAAGTGSRISSKLPKQFMDLDGKPIVAYSLDLFDRCKSIDEVILVVSEEYLAYASHEIVDKYGYKKVNKITTGGETRQESVLAGLSACPPMVELVIIHDAARPFLTMSLLEECIQTAGKSDAAILAVQSRESVKLGDGDKIVKTLKRDAVWIAQTPQVFKFDRIFDAHKRADAARFEATDDSELYEQYYGNAAIVRGSYNNIKITTPVDFIVAREILKELK